MNLLRLHQQDGAEWLAARDRGYLGDAPRVGKTRTLIAAIMMRHKNALNTLVVCPAFVRDHWRTEARTMGTFFADVKSFDEITRGGNELMKRLILEQGVKHLIIDEAHNCKNVEAKRTKQLLGKDGYARRMDTVYFASGTPLPKHAGDLWPIISAGFPEVAIKRGLTTRRDWLDRFCYEHVVNHGGWGKSILAPISGVVRNPNELREIMDEIMLRRTLDDLGLDVPPVDWQVTRLSADAIDMNWLDGSVEGRTLDEIARDPHIMRQRHDIGRVKAPLVVEQVKDELAQSNEKIVLFAHHHDVLLTLYEGLAEFKPVIVTGETPFSLHGDHPGFASTRGARLDRFQMVPECRVFIGQNHACKEGIALHAAHRAILVEPDWTAVVNEQLGNRVLDIGRPARRCVAEMVALSGTLDEAIVALNAREVRMLSQVGLSKVA